MRCWLISDNVDTLTGMRLAGVDGVIVHTREELLPVLQEAVRAEDIAVIMLTEKLSALAQEEITAQKSGNTLPLVVTVPDRHGSADMTASISRRLAETVGIHI